MDTQKRIGATFLAPMLSQSFPNTSRPIAEAAPLTMIMDTMSASLNPRSAQSQAMQS